MWQQRQTVSVCIWLQDRANLFPLSPFPIPHPHPHRSACSYFSIFHVGLSIFLSARFGKIPSISPLYQQNRRFREWCFAIFDPIFGRPPSGARISINFLSEMNIFKFWIRIVMRILPSENCLIPKCSCKNALLPVKRPWSFAIFGFY